MKDEAKAVRLFRHAAKRGAPEVPNRAQGRGLHDFQKACQGMLNYGLALLRGSGGVKVNFSAAAG